MNHEKETYLTFLLGPDIFAVNVNNVLEVMEQQQITRVPKAPDHILGIINFRGEILPVMNSHQRFKLVAGDDMTTCILIIYVIGTGEQQYKISATSDGVKDVIDIDTEEIKPVPEMGLAYDNRFIAGAVKRDGKFILIINPEKVLSVNETEYTKQPETYAY